MICSLSVVESLWFFSSVCMPSYSPLPSSLSFPGVLVWVFFFSFLLALLHLLPPHTLHSESFSVRTPDVGLDDNNAFYYSSRNWDVRADGIL